MNRIPVVNDEQRAGYGAPTTEVERPATTVGADLQPGSLDKNGYEVVVPVAKKAAPKKKPAAKAKAKK